MLGDKKVEVKRNLCSSVTYAILLAEEKRSSSWLNAFALKRYNFDVSKCEFRD